MRTYQLAGNIPVVGVQGEINAAQIEIDASDFLEEMPDGTAVLVCRRADGMIFPMASETDEAGTVTAVLGAAETAVVGRIEFELRWYEGEKLAKSRIYSGTIARTLGEPEERPEEPGAEWIQQLFAEQAKKEPAHGHPYALDGANLKEIFGGANALYSALAREDYSQIHNLDYYPIKFQGSYRDYGEWVALTGTDYYSDTACKNRVGSFSADTNVSSADSPAYYTAVVGGATRYVKMQDCQRWREKTINMTAKMEANINAYWGYGDSGTLSGKVPHIMWLARDGIASLRMRSSDEQWADSVEQIVASDGSTTEYTPGDATLKCVRYCTVDGVLKTYNTDYTVNTGTGKLTFKAGKVPTSGQEIIISRTTHDIPWIGSALYRTFNDPNYGLLRLIDDAQFVEHIHSGDSGLGMNYYAVTRTVANSVGVEWANRGKMFIPTESEVWGVCIYGLKDNANHIPQLAVFSNGGRRRLLKGASDDGSRSTYWLDSPTTIVNVAIVNSYGIPRSAQAHYASSAVPGIVGL